MNGVDSVPGHETSAIRVLRVKSQTYRGVALVKWGPKGVGARTRSEKCKAGSRNSMNVIPNHLAANGPIG